MTNVEQQAVSEAIANRAEAQIDRSTCTACGRVIESLAEYHGTCDAVANSSHRIFHTHYMELSRRHVTATMRAERLANGLTRVFDYRSKLSGLYEANGDYRGGDLVLSPSELSYLLAGAR